MPRPRSLQPAYRKHATGQGVVTLDGKDHYLGRHGTPESVARYNALLADWLGGKLAPAPKSSPLSPSASAVVVTPAPAAPIVSEILAAFMRHAAVYYAQSRELRDYTDAVDLLNRMFAALPAEKFGPNALRRIQQVMVDGEHRPGGKPLSRPVVNARVNRIRRIFRWAVSRELLPPAVIQGLDAVEPLRMGHTAAHEPAPVRPVDEQTILATVPHAPYPAGDMILLQYYTGMRPGELCRMRWADIDKSGEVWTYTPTTHKTAKLGHQRIIMIGPRGQDILRRHLLIDAELFIFSPKRAALERWKAQRAARKTPMTPSQQAREKRRRARRTRRLRDYFDTMSYGHAVAAACRRAPVEPWSPHQLRHSRGTLLRASHGVDVAGTVLGHASLSATQVYAERDMAAARRVVAVVG